MAAPTGAEREILKNLSHVPALAHLGSRTLVLLPLMTRVMCRLWGEDVFMRPSAIKAPLCGLALNNLIVLGAFD